MVSIVKWFDSLLTLTLAHFGRIGRFVESRCKFYKPLWINDSHLAHVLLGCHNKLIVNDPVGLSLKKCTAWMNIHRLVFD